MNYTNVFDQVRGQKYIALIVMTALLMWAFGVPTWINSARAAALSQVSVTLSDSNPGSVATSTINFTSAHALAAGDKITVAFPYPVGAINASNVTCPANSTASVSSNNIICTATGAVSVGDTNIIVTGVVNPALGTPGDPDSYEFGITLVIALFPENEIGYTRVMIIDNVTMTAAVSTIFEFTIAGVADDYVFTSGGATTTGTTTATTIPFETVDIDTDYFLAQKLSVSTNATNGFMVTVHQDQNLTSSVGADINLFKNATSTEQGVAAPEAWASPLAILDQYQTYGHYGITSSDSTLSTGSEFISGSAQLYAGNINAPRQVFYHTGPTRTTNNVQGSDFAYVGVKLRISNLQEAGNDYTNTLTYVATPVF